MNNKLLWSALGTACAVTGALIMAFSGEVWSQVKELDKRQDKVEEYIAVQNVYNERLLKLLEKQEQQPTPMPNQHRPEER